MPPRQKKVPKWPWTILRRNGASNILSSLSLGVTSGSFLAIISSTRLPSAKSSIRLIPWKIIIARSAKSQRPRASSLTMQRLRSWSILPIGTSRKNGPCRLQIGGRVHNNWQLNLERDFKSCNFAVGFSPHRNAIFNRISQVRSRPFGLKSHDTVQ